MTNVTYLPPPSSVNSLDRQNVNGEIKPPIEPKPVKAVVPTTIVPDINMAREFLSMLDPNAKSFTFQIVDDRPPSVPTEKRQPDGSIKIIMRKRSPEVVEGSLDAKWPKLTKLNEKGFAIFVTINETNGRGRKNENIVRIRALWRELDSGPKGDRPSIAQSIENESSSGKRHLYYLCDGLSFDNFKGCQRRMIENHGSDPEAGLLDQVLRVPGFFHCKREPVMVRLLGGTGRRYSRDEILAAFPPIARTEGRAAIKGDMPYSPAAEALVRSWIEFIPAAKAVERHDWFAQGLMFARLGDDWAGDTGDIRLDLWESLSRKAEGYGDDTGCAWKWDDILQSAARPHEKPATFRSVFYMAREGDWAWKNSGISPELIEGARAALDTASAFERPSPEDCFEIELLNDDWRARHGAAAPTAATADAKALTTQVICRCASDITPESISWVWEGYLARGMYHLLGGAPEAGKTTIVMSFAAIVSSGGEWPDGTRAKAGNVLMWTSEDSAKNTLIPRLMRMGADLDRIYFIEKLKRPGQKARPFNPATDMPELIDAAKAIGDVALLIIDPAVAVMPMTRNSHNKAESRNGMQPVLDFAEASNAAVIGIEHLTKGTAGKDPLERLNGSIAFGGIARIVMGAAKNQAVGEDEPKRIFVRIKNNVGPSGGGFGYDIEAAPLLDQPEIKATRIVWGGPLIGEARELLAEAESAPGEGDRTSQLTKAMQFLQIALKDGERPRDEIVSAATVAGITEATLRRARTAMADTRNAGRGWCWRLKGQPPAANVYASPDTDGV